ncbi:MAG: LTA synthase family protein, partial [Bacteroidaceae bacterium]|nr:LTA synthase family protein [Bacteroidaceae bacterium]
MKERLCFLIKVYIWFIAFFVLLKPIFMLKHFNIYSETPISEWFNIVKHGLEMDVSVASYIISPIIIFLIFSVFFSGKWFKIANYIYLGIISALVSIICISDLGLYSYWGFRIDSTPLFYLSNPSEAFASVNV